MSLSVVGRAQECHTEPTLPSPSGDTEQPLVLSPGSAIRLEARVDSGTGTLLKVGLEQCYGTHTGRPGRSRRVFMVVNSHGSVPGGREVENPAPGTLRSCGMSRRGGISMPWRQPGHVPVSLSCSRCLHGQNLGNVSVQHWRGGSVLQLTIAAPALEEELEKEKVRLC